MQTADDATHGLDTDRRGHATHGAISAGHAQVLSIPAAGSRRRICAAACSLLMVGVIAAGCGSGSASQVPPPHATLTRVRIHSSTTTSTTLASCGSTRDPFDATDSPPPPGSPAIC